MLNAHRESRTRRWHTRLKSTSGKPEGFGGHCCRPCMTQGVDMAHRHRNVAGKQWVQRPLHKSALLGRSTPRRAACDPCRQTNETQNVREEDRQATIEGVKGGGQNGKPAEYCTFSTQPKDRCALCTAVLDHSCCIICL